MRQREKPKSGRQGERNFRSEFLVFISRFFAIWLLTYAFTVMAPEVTRFLQKAVSAELALFLKAAGYDFSWRGTIFYLTTPHGQEKLYIIAECTGIYTTLIYLSIIGAFPSRKRDRLKGILIGVPAIHLMNLFRVAFISLILYHRRDLFDFFHGYLWQVGFIVFMLMLVFIWTAKIAKHPEEDEDRPKSKGR